MTVRFALSFLIMVMAFSLKADEDYYTKDNILRFASALYRSGDYERAIGEYLRAASMAEDGKLRDSLWLQIAQAYLYLSKPSEARRFLDRHPADPEDSLFRHRSPCLRAYSYLLENKFDSSLLVSSSAADNFLNDEWSRRSNYILIASLLKLHRWNDAAARVKQCSSPDYRHPGDSLLYLWGEMAGEGKRLRLKNTYLAGGLSMLVPGSGKIYAQRTRDGFFSMLMIGLMAWQSYEGYEKDGPISGRCITFGFLGAVFYAGNIYGSVNAARLYNKALLSAIADRVLLRFDW